jgi:hypothetical protein
MGDVDDSFQNKFKNGSLCKGCIFPLWEIMKKPHQNLINIWREASDLISLALRRNNFCGEQDPLRKSAILKPWVKSNGLTHWN